MHLTTSSELIDAGTIINGLSFNGTKPDLGCFEIEKGTFTFNLHKHNNTFSYVNFYNGNLLINLNKASSLTPLYIRLFALNGVCKYEFLVSKNSSTFSLPSQKLSSGFYCISVEGEKEIINKNYILLH